MATPAYEIGFQDYVRIIRKRWKICGLTLLTGVFLASVWSRSQPQIFEATAQVRVKPPQQAEALMGEQKIRSYRGPIVSDIARLVQSAEFAERVARRLFLAGNLMGEVPPIDPEKTARIAKIVAEMVSVKEIPQNFTQIGIVAIIARSKDPIAAADVANACAEEAAAYSVEYARARRKELREALQARLALSESSVVESNEELQELASLQEEVGRVRGEVAALEAERRLLAEETEGRDEVRRRLESPDAAAEIRSSDPAVRDLVGRLAALQAERQGILDKFTPSHPRVGAIAAEISRIMPKLRRAVDEAFDRADRRWREVSGKIDDARRRLAEAEAALRAKENPFILERRAELRVDQFGAIATRLEEERFLDMLEEGNVEVATRASVPTEAVSPPYKLHVTAGGTIGLLVGLALIFVLETLDTSIGTIEDVEAYLGLPVLGVIPYIRPANVGGAAADGKEKIPPYGPMLVAHHAPSSIPSEAFRALRTHLLSAAGEAGHRAYLLTSSGPQEGKSTTTTNLAVTLARMGSRTLLVEANMRRPTSHKVFATQRSPGLSEVLMGAAWRDLVREVPGVPNLSLMTAGAPPATNPAELLSNTDLKALFDEMKAEHDFVLVDAPPTLPVADPSIIAPNLDGVLLLYYVGKAAREAILRAKVHIEHVGGRPVGVILNHIRPEAQAGYYYYYYHYRYYGA